MAITYPLAFPTVTGINSISIVHHAIVGSTRSIYTGEEQIQAHQGQFWLASVSLPIMKRASAAVWSAFFAKLNGIEGTFLMWDPENATARGSASSAPGTPIVNGAGQTGNTLAISGAPAGATGYLKEGDYIQLASGASTRLHEILTDADTDSTGAVTLDIWPNLRESPSNGSAVVVDNAKGLFRLTEPVTLPKDVSTFYELSFNCIESLS